MSAAPTFNEPTVEVRWPQARTALVVLGGEHDLDSAPELQHTLDQSLAACEHLIVDLSGAEFIDSTTIAQLLRAKRRAVERDRRFNVVLGTAPVVERALEVSRVRSVLNVVATVEEALAA